MNKTPLVSLMATSLAGCLLEPLAPEEVGTASLSTSAAAGCIEDIYVSRYEGLSNGVVSAPPISREGALVLRGSGFVAPGTRTWVTDVTVPATTSLLAVPQRLTDRRIEVSFAGVNGRKVRVVRIGGAGAPVHCSRVVEVDARTPLANGTLPPVPEVTGWNGYRLDGWLDDVPVDGWGIFYGNGLEQEGLETLVRLRSELSCPEDGPCDRLSEFAPNVDADLDFSSQFVLPVDYAGPNQYPETSQVNWPFPTLPIADDPRVNGLAVELLLAEQLPDRLHAVASSGPIRIDLAR